MHYDDYHQCLDQHAKDLFRLIITTRAHKHQLLFDSAEARAQFIRDDELLVSGAITCYQLI
jgi:hypothetical protein